MNFKYYKIPLELSDIVGAETIDHHVDRPLKLQIRRTESLKKSIDEHIEMILTTHFGEYKRDMDYGFVIWEKEFENIQIEKFNTHNNPKQEFEQLLKKTLNKYEPRLKNIEVDILFVYKKIFKGRKIKYFVDLTIKGILVNKIEDAYVQSFQFAMGPLFK